MNEEIALNPNGLVQFLDKPAVDFTKNDIIQYIEKNNIKMLNFRYTAGDGRLKTLNFVINSRKHLDHLLSAGERVDGSNLFLFIQAESSDLYVVPRYRTAFLNPFTEIPTIDLLCSYYTADGEPLESSPENVIKRAHKKLKEKTGFSFKVLGELEYYLLSEIDVIYPIVEQRGYHESHPFSKWGSIRREAMQVISEIGGQIKYGHAEVGNIIHNDLELVQHEIEFLPAPVEDAADQLVLAKWAIREVAYKHDMEVSFAPKIIVGHAGSGLHIHSQLTKDGKNMLANNKGLTPEAKKIIAGFLELAPSLSAFGNTVPTSYLRLVPHQEAPTSICWGDFNRSVLVRVPLGWVGVEDMIYDANPNEPREERTFMDSQTIEFRSPDGSANVHKLLAGMTVAALYGLEHNDSLKIAEKLYVREDASCINSLKQLPSSCYTAAKMLQKDRKIYERDGIFHPEMIDMVIKELKSFGDQNLSEKLYGNADALKEMVDRFIHCG